MDAEAKYWKDKWQSCIRELETFGKLYRSLLEKEMARNDRRKVPRGKK